MTAQTFYLVVAFISILIAAGLFRLSWLNRNTPSGRPFFVFVGILLYWSFANALNLLVKNEADSATLTKFLYLGIAFIVPAWLVFVAHYSGEISWLDAAHPNYRESLLALGIVPAVIVIGAFTNDLHHLFWRDVQYTQVNGIMLRQAKYGGLFWLHTGYAYVLMIYATLTLVRMTAIHTRFQQTQALWILVASLIPWLSNMVYLLGKSPIIGLDLTPLAFGVSGVMMWVLLTRFEILRSTPIARDAVINGMNDGMIIVDRQGLVVDFNSAAIRLLQMGKDNILGKPISAVLREHRELRDIYYDLKEKSGTDRRDEGRLGRYGEGIYFSATLSDLNTQTGGFAGHLLLLQDISIRKRAQISAARRMTELTALREIDARISESLDVDSVLERALDSATRMSGADSGYISLVDGDKQRIVQAVGHYPSHIVGERFPINVGIVGRVLRTHEAELVLDVRSDPDYYVDIPETYAQMTFPLRLHDRTIGVLNLETSSQTAFQTEEFEFVRLLASRIASALENARLYSTTESQLKELRKLYEQVSQLEQLKTDMIRIASHDLRNPLGNLRTYIELMIIDRHMLNDEHQEFVLTMARLADRMAQLITDILSLERFQQQAHMEPIDLANIARAAITDHTPQAQAKHQTLTTDIPEAPLLTAGDYAQLREAMVNLITNAIKYTPTDGAIHISLALTDSALIFEVRDNGYGIPAENQDTLFHPFVRIADDNTRNIEGTGLGLHLVKNIIERHQGKIRFESTYGTGSTFGFELPLVVV